jgi:hypothetical protein
MHGTWRMRVTMSGKYPFHLATSTCRRCMPGLMRPRTSPSTCGESPGYIANITRERPCVRVTYFFAHAATTLGPESSFGRTARLLSLPLMIAMLSLLSQKIPQQRPGRPCSHECMIVLHCWYSAYASPRVPHHSPLSIFIFRLCPSPHPSRTRTL